MGATRLIPFVLALLALSVAGAESQTGAHSTGGQPGEPARTVNSTQVELPCSPVAAYWNGPPSSAGMPPGPQLAVVAIDVRPKDARVHLDDRFIGRARYFDGKPGYLYLEPGSYDLELRIEGYRTVRIELDSTPSCRYDLKHRLERSRYQGPDTPEIDYGKGKPFNRVFGPQVATEAEPTSSPRPGPDLGLRRDLESRSKGAQNAVKTLWASLQLRVEPDFASVSIDGVFVASGRELGLMEGPLAITAGKHEVDVSATGFIPPSTVIELVEDEILNLEIALAEKQVE